MENADETHFIIDMDNDYTLGFTSDEKVNYADVVSGGEGMTMLVGLSGRRDSKIEPLFMVLKNKGRNYPIMGTADDVAGVVYRTEPKGWIDTTVLPHWLWERKVMWPLPHQQRCTFRIVKLKACKTIVSVTVFTVSPKLVALRL